MFGLVFWITHASLDLFWIAGAVAAYKNGMLTVSQMRGTGIFQGLPYFGHGGMWNDLVVHTLIAIFAQLTWQRWDSHGYEVFFSMAFGLLAATIVQGLLWPQSKVMEAHGSMGMISSVGIIHIPHMVLIVASIVMMILCKWDGAIPWSFFFGAASILVAHVLMGDHPFLKTFRPDWYPAAECYPNLYKGWTIISVIFVLDLIGASLIYKSRFDTWLL